MTSDGGKTWTGRGVPAQVVMRVRPSSATGASIVSAGRDCQPGVRSTADGGATWSQATEVGATWFRDAKDAQVVHSLGARSGHPCDASPVLDLAPLTASGARVLCGDGSVRASDDSGASWKPVGVVPGALGLDSCFEKGAGTAYVLRIAGGCAGLQVVRVGQTAAAAQVLGCVEVSGPMEPGTIALSVTGSDGWVGVGERTWRSQDSLRTWAPV